VRLWDGSDRGEETDFQNGLFGDRQGFFFNDTFKSPQYLGAVSTKLGNNLVQITGRLTWRSNKLNDEADFYGVALMAGQTVSARLLDPFFPVSSFDINGNITPFPGSPSVTSETRPSVFDPAD